MLRPVPACSTELMVNLDKTDDPRLYLCQVKSVANSDLLILLNVFFLVANKSNSVDSVPGVALVLRDIFFSGFYLDDR